MASITVLSFFHRREQARFVHRPTILVGEFELSFCNSGSAL